MNRAILLTGVVGAASPLLIDSALKGAALLFAAAALAMALRRCSAAARHLIWVCAIASLLVLPTLSPLLPEWRVLPRWPGLTASTPSAGPNGTIAPAPEPATLDPETPAVARPDSLVSPMSAPGGEAKEQPSATIEWIPIIWAIGFVLLVIRLLVAYGLLVRRTRKCVLVADGRINEMLGAIRHELGVGQNIQCLLDDRRSIPMVFGLWRPRLILPAQAEQWEDGQLRSVLLHELAHVKRHDLAVQWIVQITCALYWFHPLVWLAAWRLHVESEHACDNLVLVNGVRASDYAEHVLHVATRFAPVPGCHALGLAMARPSRLEGRMLAVLNSRMNRRGVTRAVLLAALLMGLCAIVPVAMLRAADEEKKEAPIPVPVPAPAPAPVAQASSPPQIAIGRAADTSVILEVAASGPVSLDGQAVTLSTLPDELKRMKAQNPEVQVRIRAAAGVRFDRIVKVMDVLREAHVVSVAFVTTADADTEIAQIRLGQAERGWKRAEELRRQNLISEAERDDALQELEVARAEVNGNKADVNRSKLRRAEAQLKRVEKLSAQNLVDTSELDKVQLDVKRLQTEALGDSGERSRAELDLAKAELAFAQANLNRTASLAEKKLVSQSQLEMVKAETAIAEAKFRMAEARWSGPNARKPSASGAASPANAARKERLLQILSDEIKIAEQQTKLAREQQQAGTTGLETSVRADLEVLALKREMAGLNSDLPQMRDLISRQIVLLQDLEHTVREARQGAAGEAEALKVRRQILGLQREQAQLE